ncbi:MAG TPA: SGNH/GDSL hydrolase family protein [Acidobacteriaceae bacterium]|jgi:lysophospholipase L1-like esterase
MTQTDKSKSLRILCLISAWIAMPVLSLAQQAPSPYRWVGSWAASPQLCEPQNSIAQEDADHVVLRQIVHLSLGGSSLRMEISNEFGTQPLEFTAAHVALATSPATSAIAPATDKTVTFSGLSNISIPAGAKYVSDPVSLSVTAGADLAITMAFDHIPQRQTGHPGSRATSYLAHGVSPEIAELAQSKHIEHWFFLSGVSVTTTPSAAAVVALGDSITDGHGATTNGNDRWPDNLARRLHDSNLSVLNEGIGGNRLLADGLGPNALSRFDRDVLAQPGVRYVVVLEGINDLGTATRASELSTAQHAVLVQRIISAYAQLIVRAHEHGLPVFLGTITPFVGSDYYHPNADTENDRQQINAWIRAIGHADALIDFDKAVADPAHPERLLPAFDSGDHLHPSPAGYRAMSDAISLSFFAPAASKRPAAK